MTSDESLLDGWRAGDRACGSRLFGRYFEALRRFFGSKTALDVDDLIQQTFLALVEGQARIRRPSSFKAYLFAVARRVLCARYHARLRNREDIGQCSAHDLMPSPSRHLAATEEQQQLVESLRRLPLDHQISLELFYWEDMTAGEIAEVLDVPEGTVRSRIRRARHQLAQYLESLPGGDTDEERGVRMRLEALRDTGVLGTRPDPVEA